MNEITEEDFYNFLYTQNIIDDLIEEKTKELSMIMYGRLPIGEMCDVSVEEFKPGHILLSLGNIYMVSLVKINMSFL